MPMIIGTLKKDASSKYIAQLEINVDWRERICKQLFRISGQFVLHTFLFLSASVRTGQKKTCPDWIRAGSCSSFITFSKHSCALIRFRSMPPPCCCCKVFHFNYSPFFFAAALFGFAGVAAAASAGFLEATRFKRTLIAFLFLVTPKEPLERLPFADFLSPL